MKTPKMYNITPAKGQALLSFQDRQMPTKVELFETEVIEEVHQPNKQGKKKDNFRNLLIQGDCLSACAYLKSKDIKVDLVYIDPPFASGANYARKIYLRNGGRTEVETEESGSIGEEIMYGDIWQKEDYLNWLYERLLVIREVMSEKASIYVHLDWHVGAYVKIMLDEIFGEVNFLNEIYWHYYNKLHGASKNVFPRATDNILYYAKNIDNYVFHHQTEQRDKPIKKLKYHFINGKIVNDKDAEGHTITYMSTEKQIDNVWTIRALQPADNQEWFNYGTQKPQDLIERAILASSNEEDVVADFFCGSGTTGAAAFVKNRHFITCDIGLNAVQTTRDRLLKAGAEFDILKVQDGVRLFRNPAQTTKKLFGLLEGFKDRTELELSDFWDGGLVGKKSDFVPLKFIGIDKKLTKQLLDYVLEEIYQLEDDKKDVTEAKIIYAYADPEIDQKYVNKEIKDKGKTTIAVEVVSLDTLLGEKVDALYTPDNADIKVTKDKSGCKVEIKKFFSSYLKSKIDEYNSRKAGKNGDLFETKEKQSKQKVKISDSGLELIEAVQFDTTLQKNGVWKSNLELEDKAGIKDKIKGAYTLKTNKFKIKIRNIAGDEIVLDYSE